jgi:DNA-directed RNA polymerase I, II, and III subunit RPABC4
MTYMCGNCERDVVVRRGGVSAQGEMLKEDAMMCRECGEKILYKKRTNRVMQFEAR